MINEIWEDEIGLYLNPTDAEKGHTDYQIEWDRCNTKEKILEWSAHLCEKNWITTFHIRTMIESACDHHKLELWIHA